MKILFNDNPLDPIKGMKERLLPCGITGNQAFELLGLSESQPTILIVNNEAWGRADWNKPLPSDGIIVFSVIPQDAGLVVAIVGIVISLILSAISYYYSNQNNTDTTNPRTVYSLTGGRNQLRMGQPFAEPVGRLRIYPDLVQESYTQMEQTGGIPGTYSYTLSGTKITSYAERLAWSVEYNQYLYFLGIIGVGEYDVEGVYIDNTPILDYLGTDYNIIPPGGSPTLVPRVVWTCGETANAEIDTDWLTYSVSAPGTITRLIEYDLTFPAGLVRYDDEGDSYKKAVHVITEIRAINSAGECPGPEYDWQTLESIIFYSDSKEVFRISRQLSVPWSDQGRYQFRIRRTISPSTDSKVLEKTTLTGLKAYGDYHGDYSNAAGMGLTLIECKIKATDQLSGDASSRINVIATRKLLPVTATGFGPIPIATRNIADFCAYAVTAYNGGRQDESIVDWASLYELRESWETSEYYFDYKFTDRTSVMDSCAMAATCGRAVPYMPGGLFSLVMDELQALPTCVFTRDNIKDLKITTTPRTADSLTCINMTYVDPESWEDETITCLDENGSEDNPSEITLDGCASRQQAYEIGMYLYQQDMLERTTVEFTTSLMGHIPSLLSKIVVPNTMIKWGQDGLVMDYDNVTGLLWLSEPVDFDGQASGAMYLCLGDGSSGGPYTVYPSVHSHAVESSILDAVLFSEDAVKASRYLFGPAENVPMFVRVSQIQPQSSDTVKIVGTMINDDVYVDPGDSPGAGTSTEDEDFLESASLTFSGPDDEGDYTYVVSWLGSASAVQIETSEAGTEESYVVLEASYINHYKTFTASSGIMYVRIIPYDDESALFYADTIVVSKDTMAAPSGLSVTYDSTGFEATWDAYSGATSYILEIIVDDETVLTLTSSSEYISATMDQIEAKGGPWSSIEIELRAVTGDGSSQAASTTAEYTSAYPPEVPLHASNHTDGTDDIQDATTSQKGLMTAAQAAKLEALALESNPPYDIGGTFNGLLSSNFVLSRIPAVRDITLPVGLTGSRMVAEVAATSEAILSLRKDGVEFGTATFPAAGTEATFASAAETVFSSGNIFKIVAPSTPDATLASLGWVIVGSR